MVEQQELYLRIAPDRFHLLKFILEGYDNLAILSSHDMARGIVRLRFISSSAPELTQLLASLAGQLQHSCRTSASSCFSKK